MKVKDVMKTALILIHKDTPYHEVARTLYENKISGAPVVDEEGNLVGIISEKDLFRVMYPYYGSFYNNPGLYFDLEERENKIHEIKDKKIENFMTEITISVSPDTPIMKVGATMTARDINRMPVLENGKLVGIVSRGDIFKKILQNKLGF